MKHKRKLTIEDRVGAILDRDNGDSYEAVLDRYNLTPNRFFRAVNQDISNLILSTSKENARALEGITSDFKRKRELFNMGEEFIK